MLQNIRIPDNPKKKGGRRGRFKKPVNFTKRTQACVTNMLSLGRASCMFSQICHAANAHFHMVTAQRTRHLSNAVG